MFAGSILKRKGTENTYHVTYIGHWSDIVNINDPTDFDCVEYISGNYYKSANKGYIYTVIGEREISREEQMRIHGWST